MYAIIEDSGSQIRVSEGDVIKIDPRELADDAATVTFDRVLYIGGDGEARIGEPLLSGASVEADILEEGRDEKIEVVKFRRRKNYHRRNGHRQPFIKVRVTKIAG